MEASWMLFGRIDVSESGGNREVAYDTNRIGDGDLVCSDGFFLLEHFPEVCLQE